MALYTGKTPDQYKSDYESAQREYSNLQQGISGSLVSVSSLEHAKKKLDLAANDYGQAQRTQNTSSASSGTYGTINTPVLNEFLANHKATSPINYFGDASQRLKNGIDFNSFTPVTTDNTKNLLGSHDKTPIVPVKTMQLSPRTPSLLPTFLPIASEQHKHNQRNEEDKQAAALYTVDNIKYRTAIDQSVIDADPSNYAQIKNDFDSKKALYNTLNIQASHGSRNPAVRTTEFAQKLAQAKADYEAATRAYNTAEPLHEAAVQAKAANEDTAKISQLESFARSAPDYKMKVAQGQQLFDENYLGQTAKLPWNIAHSNALGAMTDSEKTHMLTIWQETKTGR